MPIDSKINEKELNANCENKPIRYDGASPESFNAIVEPFKKIENEYREKNPSNLDCILPKEKRKGWLGGLLFSTIAFWALFGFFYCNENAKIEENKRQLAELKAMPTVEYIVQPGDVLYKIEEMFIKSEDRQKYHDDNTLKRVLELNPWIGKNYKIQPGQTVKLPSNR
jgi:hypothetical protein